MANLQQMLNDLGYDAGTADGVTGSRTIEALHAFERDRGEPLSGEISNETIAAVRGAWLEHQRTAAATPDTAQATPTRPSFDCAQAGTATERQICASPLLAKLDAEIAGAYRSASTDVSPADRSRMIAEQRAWIRSRDACGGERACLERSLTARRDELLAAFPGGAAPMMAGPSQTNEQWIAPSQNVALQPGGTNSNPPAADIPGLPDLQGLPAINLSQQGDALASPAAFSSDPSAQPGAHVPPATRGWTRAIRLLSVAVRADKGQTISDDEALDLACIFLTPDERAALYTRSPLYGPGQEVCETESATRSPLGISHLLKHGADAFRTTDLPDLLRQAPQLPLQLLLLFDATTAFDGYDRSRGGYPMEGAGYQLKLLDSALDTRLPDFWSISEDAAAAFEVRRRANRTQPLVFALPVTITGAEHLDGTPGTPINPNSGLPAGASWRIEEGTLTLYENATLDRPLYHFTPAQTGRRGLAATADATPGSAASPDQTAPTNGGDMARRWALPVVDGIPLLPAAGAGVGFGDLASIPRFSRAQRDNWQHAILALSLAAKPSATATLTDENMGNVMCWLLPPRRQQALFGRPCNGPAAPVRDFDLKDAVKAFRRSDLPAFTSTAPHLPLRFLLTIPLSFDAWDQQKGGFRVANPTGPEPPTIFGGSLPMVTPASWPASYQEARQFDAAARELNGGWKQRAAVLAVPVTITGVASQTSGTPNFDSNSGLPVDMPWQFEIGDVVLYADTALTHKLYHYGSSLSFSSIIAGTPAAESPRPAAPLLLNADTAFLLLQRPGGADIGGIDWTKAAQARSGFEGIFRTRTDWKQFDAWGVYFPSQYNPTDTDVAGYRAWTQKRAAAVPNDFVIRQDLAANNHHDAIAVFNRLSSSSWIGNEPRFNAYPQSLTDRGITEAQLLPVQVDVPGVSLSVIFALPKPRSSYVLAVPQGVRRSDAASVVDASVSFAGAEIINLDSFGQQQAILMRLNPTGATLRSDGVTIATVSFPPDTWPAAVAQRTAAPRLDAALIDLIVAKSVGDKLSQEALAYLVTRRWQDENGRGVATDERFFRRGAPLPAPQAAADMAPAFLTWARAHAPQLPEDVTISTDAEVAAGQSSLPWWTFPCLNAMVASGPSLDTLNMSIRGEAASAERQKSNAAHGSAHWSELDEQKLARLNAQTKVLDTSYFGSIGGTCRISPSNLGFTDPLAISMFIGHSLPTPAIKTLGGRKRLEITVTLAISSVSLSSSPPSLGSLLPPDLARDWPQFQAGQAPKGEFVTLDANFVEARYTEPGGAEIAQLGADQGTKLDSIVADLRTQLAAIPPTPPAPEPAETHLAAGDGTDGPIDGNTGSASQHSAGQSLRRRSGRRACRDGLRRGRANHPRAHDRGEGARGHGSRPPEHAQPWVHRQAVRVRRRDRADCDSG